MLLVLIVIESQLQEALWFAALVWAGPVWQVSSDLAICQGFKE